MLFLNKLKIKYRILIAVVVPILITATILTAITAQQIKLKGENELATLEYNLLESKKESLKNIVNTAISTSIANNSNLKKENLKQEIINRLRAVKYENSNYIFVYERAKYPNNFKNLAYNPDPNKEGLVSQNNEKLQKLLTDLFNVAESNNNNFYSYEWPNPASKKTEPKLSYAVIYPEFDLMIGTGIYVNDIKETITAAKIKLNKNINNTIIILLSSTIGAILFSFIIGYLVSLTVTKPIKNVTDVMADIARGEGNLTERLPANGNDELSNLGKEFNEFITKIQNIIKEVNSTTELVATSAEELSCVSTETKNNIEIQNTETEQIASSINEMASTIHQISRNANEAQSHSSDSDRISKEAGKTMAISQNTIKDMSDSIIECTNVIESLASRSNEIQSILDVIHNVTEQTNLLALNAAIEAARAGEHGRGFAVVADEVRQLARKSDESASQIRDMINGFINETTNAVSIMRTSKDLSDQTVDRIQHTSDSLKTIEKSVEEITDQITQIAAGAEQQSQVAEEVNQNIVRIVEAAQNSSNGISQTNEASQELAQLSESLKKLIGQFKM